jgi:Protein phosphatase 2C
MSLSPVVCFSGKVPKQGNRFDECEDEIQSSLETGHFAVADGATEASYAQQWARILVSAFRQIDSARLDTSSFELWLDTCRREWSAWADSLNGKTLPWFTQEKLSIGSFATFLGLCFDYTSASEDSLIWRAVAYGDSCLFVVQSDTVLREAFPIQEPDQFSLTPPLLGTGSTPVGERLRLLSGSVSQLDKMYLATDALAHWFVESYRAFAKPWESLDTLRTEDDLGAFVDGLRADHLIRNDDVALVRIVFAIDR